MPSEAGSQPPASEAERLRTAQRELVRAYKRFAATEDGRQIIADLMDRYGFDKHGVERDDYVPGATGIDLARKDGAKSPLRYILKMKNLEMRPLGDKPRRGQAKS